MFYFLTFGILTLLAFVIDSSKKRGKISLNYRFRRSEKIYSVILIYIIFGTLFLLAALRYYVGVDYKVYLVRYIPQVMANIPDAVEIGYKYIILLGIFLGNSQWVFAITHLVILMLLYYSIRKYSVSIGWSIFVLTFGTYFNFSLSIMRQSIAISIFLVALNYLYEKKMTSYLISILIASLFHLSALFFIPLAIFAYIPFKRTIFITIIIISAVLRNSVQSLLLAAFKLLGDYEGYLTAYEGRNTTSGSLILEIVPVILLILFVYSKKNNNIAVYEDRILGILSYFQAISISIIFLSTMIPQFERMVMMYSFSNILLIGRLFSSITNNNLKKLLMFIFVVCYLIVFFQVVIVKSGSGSYPYRFIFEKNIYLY